jgi:hypothetical protein
MLCCRFCPTVKVDGLTGPELLKHMAAHIKHNIRLRDVENVCGLCLSSTGECCFYLVKKGQAITISKEKSRCKNFRQFNLRKATEHTQKSQHKSSYGLSSLSANLACDMEVQSPGSYPSCTPYSERQSLLGEILYP